MYVALNQDDMQVSGGGALPIRATGVSHDDLRALQISNVRNCGEDAVLDLQQRIPPFASPLRGYIRSDQIQVFRLHRV